MFFSEFSIPRTQVTAHFHANWKECLLFAFGIESLGRERGRRKVIDFNVSGCRGVSNKRVASQRVATRESHCMQLQLPESWIYFHILWGIPQRKISLPAKPSQQTMQLIPESRLKSHCMLHESVALEAQIRIAQQHPFPDAALICSHMMHRTPWCLCSILFGSHSGLSGFVEGFQKHLFAEFPWFSLVLCGKARLSARGLLSLSKGKMSSWSQIGFLHNIRPVPCRSSGFENHKKKYSWSTLCLGCDGKKHIVRSMLLRHNPTHTMWEQKSRYENTAEN